MHELPQALLIDPYDREHFADTIHTALTMREEERANRMCTLRTTVEQRDVYHWAEKFLSTWARSDAEP